MADEKNTEKQNDTKQQESGEKTSTKSYLKWIIMAVVVIFCAGAGFGLGRLFGGSASGPSPSGPAADSPQSEPTDTPAAGGLSATQSASGGWYYDFEPVVANLNEPGATRYIRVTLTLQISTELDSKKGIALLEEKKPLLRNWLTIYLASQALEDIRGDRNLRRIQSEILDAFNEKLFPDAKGKIRNVLFKEFAVQ